MELMFTMRDVDDLKLQRRATMSLPWLTDILHGCEANLAERQKDAAVEQVQQRTAAAPPQPPEADGLASAHDHDPSWCLKHQVTMRWHDGNARGPGWFSHQLADGSYCKGK
jgi:hypothetical protein